MFHPYTAVFLSRETNGCNRTNKILHSLIKIFICGTQELDLLAEQKSHRWNIHTHACVRYHQTRVAHFQQHVCFFILHFICWQSKVTECNCMVSVASVFKSYLYEKRVKNTRKMPCIKMSH